MKNILAQKVARAAEKYMQSLLDGDFGVDNAACIKQDYEDLMSIANLIEDGASEKVIANAMWRLDTAVRDVIPDAVYYIYNK